jgi:hypothetical protein
MTGGGINRVLSNVRGNFPTVILNAGYKAIDPFCLELNCYAFAFMIVK